MPPPLTLKELMQLCYNAGREDVGSRYWHDWWKVYGKHRHDAVKEDLITAGGTRLIAWLEEGE